VLLGVLDMSHTTRGRETIFTHNSDMSGAVNITNELGKLTVNASDIIYFALEYLRKEKISRLEQLEGHELREAVINAL